MAPNDPTFTQSANQVRLTTAVIVVLLLSLYAHSAGDKMGAEFPRKDRTLAAGDAVYVVARPETCRRLDARSRPPEA